MKYTLKILVIFFNIFFHSSLSAAISNSIVVKVNDKIITSIDIQDEIIETIVSTIVGRVEADVIQQSKTVRPDNLAAYDLVLQGLDYHRRSGITKDNAEKAFNLF